MNTESDAGICVSFVVAASENGVIGAGGRLPWRLGTDWKLFRRITMGKPVIMGRKTFESLGEPLQGRDNIVITRNKSFAPSNVHVAHSVDNALKLGRVLAKQREAGEIAIIGGEEIFRDAMPRARRIYLTRVHVTLDGDTFFAPIDAAQWREVSRKRYAAGPKDDYDFSFIVLERRSKVAEV